MMKIEEIRKEKKMTQRELCKKAGIGAAQIQRYESGSRSPTVLILEKIAAALGVDAKKLI